jgi:hypothetical protein
MILVYNKNPMGVLHLPPYRIYGNGLRNFPVDVPYSVYIHIIEAVQDGSYRKEYLQKHFPGPFDEIAFTYRELKFLPRRTLEMLCNGMKIRHRKRHTNKALIGRIKQKLKNVASI